MFNFRRNISAGELRELYLNQGLTMTEIAERYQVAETTIRRRLSEIGVISRPRGPKGSRDLPHAEITEELLRELYLQRKLSIPQIAELVGWGRETVRQRMIEYGIPIRSFSQANLIQFGTYDEYRDFDGNAQQKAYLIGFRLGDLTVTRTNKTSDMIYVSGGSSKREQIELFEHLFAQYGHVTRSSEVRLSLRGFLHYQNFRVTLKSSFDFLLEYPIGIPSWVLDDDSIFVAFFGGFTDAEGSFGASLPQRRYGSLASNKKNLCSV